MPLYGIDISHHQGTAVDLGRVDREGFDFAIFKATEGSAFVDSRFRANLAAGRRAGLLCAAYHYQRGSVSAAAQVAHIKRVVPRSCPVIPDVEKHSGGVGLTREIVRRLRDAGYTVPLAYLPRWYWQQLGRPSLEGLPPLWSSRYLTRTGYASQIYEDVPDHFWHGYGGNRVAVLQYSSSATVAGHQPVDVNAYRGSRDQLADLLGSNTNHQEDDMSEADVERGLLSALKKAAGEATDDLDSQYGRNLRNALWQIIRYPLRKDVRRCIEAQRPLLEAAADGRALSAEEVQRIADAAAAAVPDGLAADVVNELTERLDGETS